jgi:sugar phosphate isomerase/epimerase
MEIGIGSWSLRNLIRSGELSLVDYPRFVKEEFGVKYVELSQQHFASVDSQYLSKIRQSLDEAEVAVLNVPVDLGDISNPNDRDRQHDIRVLELWIDIAAYLRSSAVRVNTGKHQDEAGFQRTVASLRHLAEYCAERGLVLVLENHGGISSDPASIERLFKEVGKGNFRSCPDFGNFREEQRLEGLRVISQYAFLAHAKTYDFEPNGEFSAFDFGSCMKVLKESGFDGVVSVEFEGKGNQVSGVRQSIELMKKTWAKV